MPTVYSGLFSPYAKPAIIETDPIVDNNGIPQTIFAFIALDKITIDVSLDRGVTWTSYTITLNAPNLIYNSAQSLVDYLNQNFVGVAPTNFEWFVPSFDRFDGGTLIKNTFGVRVGVRTKGALGELSAIRFNPDPTKNTGLGNTKLNVPVGKFAKGYSGFTELLPQPSPFDPFVALSVNLYERGLMERDLNLVTDLKFYCSYSSTLRAESLDGATIVLSNIPSIFQYNQVATKPIRVDATDKTVTLSSANLGGNFAANTWYYVYNYWDTANQILQYEISTTNPSNSNPLYKNGDTSRRYMFSFVTDTNSLIIPFIRQGNDHSYFSPQSILVDGNSDMSAVNISTLSYISPLSRIGKLKSKYVVNSGALAFYFLFPGGQGNVPGQGSIYTGTCNINGGREDYMTLPIRTNLIDYKVDNNVNLLSLDVMGFTE